LLLRNGVKASTPPHRAKHRTRTARMLCAMWLGAWFQLVFYFCVPPKGVRVLVG
jgi:hypothetical protein